MAQVDGYAISRQNNLELHLGCHIYLLNELLYIGMPVGRTDGRFFGFVSLNNTKSFFFVEEKAKADCRFRGGTEIIGS